ncbi:unnamed protein product [Meganyctiphanes norvegica]|uniref:Uncharacterized protein n=1 Tax=Meganyctiphanes norvegica TaxID=48144 RepID=A0AAV2QGB9_MEGNR
MKTSRSLDMVEESAEPLTLTRISDLSKSANPIKVGFSNNAAVTDITELFLVVIKHEDSNPFEQSWVDTMDSLNDIPENNEEVIFSFPYDDDRLPKVEDGDDVTLVVVAHAGEIALAAGEFTFVFDASTSASLAWVGAAKDNPDAFLRVNTESSVNIGSGCSGGDAGTFYCPQPNVDLNDLEICVEVEGTGNDGSGLTVSQCDESVTPKAFTEISAIGNTELHIKTNDDREFEISATYLSSSTKVDVLFYEDDVPSTSSGCDANKDPCQVEAPAVVANILLVGLTSDDEVVESKIITTFEEYSVVLNQLSADAVEVTWSGSTSTSAHKLSNLSATTEYEVTIDDDSAPFTKTAGNGCDNDDCKAYFVKTTSIIKCSVYQTAKPSMKSSRSLDMTATPPTQAKFTFINKMDSSISIDVTSDSQLTSDVVSLVVITVSDAEGKEEITEGTQALVRADSKYQFPVDLHTSGDKLYFILVGHQQNGDIAFAGTNSGVLNGFTTTLAWVGAATSQDSNDASLKISTSDDVTLSEDCACIVSSNTPCYCIHTDLKEEDILLCSNLDDDGAKYCDNSIGVDQYIDFTNIKKSRLFYPLDSSENPHYEFESEVASDSTYEIQFLIGDTPGGDGVYTCGDASTCSVPLSNIPGNYQIYQVLTVATDGDGDIQKSREFPFEDYKTTVQPLLPDMILVNWEATEDTTYIVDCKAVTPGAAEPLPTSTHCDGSTVTCKALFTSLDCDKKVYTLEVKKDSDKNVVAGQVETLACNAKDLSVSTPELRYDDHISVCFSKPPDAHHYQLVLAHDGVVIEAELIDAALVDVDNEGRLCLVSSRILSLGSYVDLVAVVVVYDNDGNIITSGKTNWQAILLSSDRWVQAAITDGTTMISSWQVIDDSQGISNFELTLKSDKGTGTKVIQVSSEQTSYKVSDIAAGSYSVCVRAVSSTIKSEEVCSGIITVNENAGIDIPPPETTQPKSSGNDSVMLTWSHQEDVTAYMVHWRSNSALSQSKLLKKLNSLSFVHPIKYRADESEGLSFKIIPSSSSSFEISGLGKGEWNVCLSGVKDGNVGKESCQQSHVDPDSYEEINAPTNLLIEDSVLKWDVINNVDRYFVEWVPHSSGETGGHLETSEASFNLVNQTSPGDWTFSVRAIRSSQLGNTQSIRHTLIGIQLNWYQVGSRSLLVDWQEKPAPETSNATYVVSYKQGDDNAKTTEIDCKFDVSGSCQVYLLDIDVDTSKVVSLLVARKEGDTKRDISIQLRNLKDTTQLEQTMKSSNQAIVSWTAVDGADCYNVSLLRNQQLLKQKWQTLPLSITFDDEQLEGCDVRVQPCIDQKHCMDGKQIQLNIVAPNSSGDEGGVVVVSVLGGVLGAAVLVMAIIVVVYKYKTNQREAIGSQHYSDASGGDRARRVSTVSILGQTQMNNQMELQPSRPTRPTRHTYQVWR